MDIVKDVPDEQRIKALISADIQELPPIPAVAIKLLQLTAAEDVIIADLSRVIKTDPSLAVKVLRLVNSAAYQLPKRITSLQHAVTILGFSRIRQVALGLSLFQHLRRHLGSPRFDMFHYWQHCLSVATIAKSLARASAHTDPDAAYVAGLLHDIGKLILETYGKISYSEILSSFRSNSELLIEEERKVLGIGHDDIGDIICRQWGLPENITTVVRLHHRSFTQQGLSAEDEKLVAIVSLANFIAWTQGIGSVNQRCRIVLQPEVEQYIDLDELDLSAIVQQLDREVSEIGQFYQLHFPTSDQLRANLLQATLQLNRINSSYYFGAPLQSTDSNAASVKESLLTPHRSLDAESILSMTLEALHKELPYKTLLYLVTEPGSRKLTFKRSFPPDSVNAYSDFEMELTAASGAFLDCLRLRSPAVADGRTPAEQKALSLLNTEFLGLAPVTGSGRLMGILAVIPVSGIPLSGTEELNGLALVAGELGLALEHAELFTTVKVQADHDPLTGIFNRRSFLAHLDQIIEQLEHTAPSLAIGMVDVDHFKQFNDRFGHTIGDKVLRLITDTMNAENRSSDLIGRYGGDEFIFALTGVTENEAVLFAERLRKAVEAKGKQLAKRFEGQPLSISIGLTMCTGSLPTTEALITAADTALYRAKQQGKNRVMV
ncbi:MAG: HDOD domain-containing protein [Sedimenticola sp.]